MSVFSGNWTDVSDVIRDFQIDVEAVDGCEFIVAEYTYEDYSGSAFVLFLRDGKLWEVHGSHCSCNGLEGQWEPEETTKDSLQHILDKGTYFGEYRSPEAAARVALAILGKLGE